MEFIPNEDFSITPFGCAFADGRCVYRLSTMDTFGVADVISKKFPIPLFVDDLMETAEGIKIINSVTTKDGTYNIGIAHGVLIYDNACFYTREKDLYTFRHCEIDLYSGIVHGKYCTKRSCFGTYLYKAPRYIRRDDYVYPVYDNKVMDLPLGYYDSEQRLFINGIQVTDISITYSDDNTFEVQLPCGLNIAKELYALLGGVIYEKLWYSDDDKALVTASGYVVKMVDCPRFRDLC